MNELQFESSPYLLQHAKNPVNWKAWNEKSRSLAIEQNKLLLVSIGYSTCHWCHVMEHECFEDEEVAALMNELFVSVKVDREERPDVDSYYMKAVILTNQQGGWPLNVVCLPDGKPVWGGTYFRKSDWMNILKQLNNLFQTKPDELTAYGKRLSDGIAAAGKAPVTTEKGSSFDLEDLVESWNASFDSTFGGYGQPPKFMLPNSLNFLQKYYYLKNDSSGLEFVDLSLKRMAWGGLFDTAQGGFSRYSVDERWHIPHFEKMLYDNAQLLSLYADGYKRTKEPLLREVIIKTISFIEDEWSNGEGGFYSAYDADSTNDSGKLEEGAYYSWQEQEIKRLINEEDLPIFKDLFNINSRYKWENNKYVLMQTEELTAIAERHGLRTDLLEEKKKTWERLLKVERENRIKPRLDDKTLTSWNAMLIIGLLDSYTAIQEKSYLKLAENTAQFISDKLLNKDLNLKHTYKNGEATIDGFLEDYAFYISALISLYEHTLNTDYLSLSQKLTDKLMEDFFDQESGFFFFSNKKQEKQMHNSVETDDGVIPSANSQMANNLLKLGLLFENMNYTDIAVNMVETMKHNIQSAPYYSNWLLSELYLSEPAELVVGGKDALKEVLKIRQEILVHTLVFGSDKESDIPYLKGKFKPESTRFFFCTNRVCIQPVESGDFIREKRL